jgi:transcription elongation factor GreA
MTSDKTYLTPDGLRQLEEELEFLRSVRRREVAERIQGAKEVGGTADNAEFEEAKNELVYVEGRRQTVEAMLQNAVIIPDHNRKSAASEVVELGSIVEVRLGDAKKSQIYTVVGSTEASPSEGLISNESPVGKALMGKRAGDEVKVEVPAGTQKLKIITVK